MENSEKEKRKLELLKKSKAFVPIKDTKGITLVALVVTIVVLLILAGVTIAKLLGNNSIIQRAQKARDKTKNAVDKEMAGIENLGNVINDEVAGIKDITTITTTDHRTLKAKDKYGNIVTVPEGFKVVAGKEDEEISVQNGVVIEDSAGNQFVWIPVGKVTKKDGSKSKEIVLGRYTFADKDSTDPEPGTPTLVQNAEQYVATTAEVVKNNPSTVSQYRDYYYYYELSDSIEGLIDTANRKNDLNATAKNLAEFVRSVKNNGGYYLARYEASYGSGYNKDGTTDALKYANAKPLSKPSTAHSEDSMSYTEGTLWNFITQLNASKVARNMYAENKDINKNTVGVESDLVNSYAWDTAIVYIQEMGNTNYANANRGTNTSLKDTGSTGDVKCNIYDMAGNTYEWTTGYSTYTPSSSAYPCVVRGGGCNVSSSYSAYRYYNYATFSYNSISLRLTLYVK